MTVNIRVELDTREKINTFCQSAQMSQGVMVGYLVDLNEKHDFFDKGWRDKIAEEAFRETLDKRYEEERQRLTLQTHRQMLKTKGDLLKLYVLSMPKDERKIFLERVLGDLKSDNLLDVVVNYQLFMVDGERRACQPGPEGKPVITGVDPSRIVSCERGFHILEAWCKCDVWRRCPLRLKEYETWLVEHGSESERNRYLEDRNR